MADNEHITIPMKVYKQLLEDSRVLEALEAGGTGALAAGSGTTLPWKTIAPRSLMMTMIKLCGQWLWHPESPGGRIYVVRGFWGRLFKPKDFATLNEVSVFYQWCSMDDVPQG